MFTLQDLIQEVISAEGSQMAQFTSADGTLNKKKLNTIIPIVNSALDEIFKRFVVRNSYIEIRTKEGVRDYEISPEHVVGVSNDPHILDEEFNTPIIAITSLADLHGRNIPLNTATKRDARRELQGSNVRYGSNAIDIIYRKFSTPKYNVLRVPPELPQTDFILGVRVAHQRIPLVDPTELETFDISEVTIDLPTTYITAMVYFIMARVCNMKGAATIGRTMYHEGDSYYNKFLRECDSLRQSDSEVNEQIDYANCFTRTGFV